MQLTWLCTVVECASPLSFDTDQSERFSAGITDDGQTGVVTSHVSTKRRCQLSTPDYCIPYAARWLAFTLTILRHVDISNLFQVSTQLIRLSQRNCSTVILLIMFERRGGPRFISKKGSAFQPYRQFQPWWLVRQIGQLKKERLTK